MRVAEQGSERLARSLVALRSHRLVQQDVAVSRHFSTLVHSEHAVCVKFCSWIRARVVERESEPHAQPPYASRRLPKLSSFACL